MSDSRSPSRSMFPPRHSPEFTPALAAVALTMLIALQLILTSRTELPASIGLAPRRARAAVVAPIPAYPALLAGGVFSPDRAGAGGIGAVSSASIDDCSAVGVISVGHTALALIKSPGAAPRAVRRGETVCGWRLSQIESTRLDFALAGQRRHLDVGAAPLSSSRATPAPGAQTPTGVETAP